MLHNRNEQPEARKRQPRSHAKLTTGGKDISANMAALSGVTVRHAHRTPVATDKRSLHARELARGESVPCADGVTQSRGSQ